MRYASINPDLLSPTEIDFRGGAGRIYVTSPTFGIDLSVDSVGAELTTYHEHEDFYVGGLHRRRVGSLCVRSGYELRLRFEMPGLDIRYPLRDGANYAHLRDLMDPGGRVYLLDHGKPIPPRLPIWLPPGVWKCCFCDGLQSEGLLQCRACGGRRFEAPE